MKRNENLHPCRDFRKRKRENESVGKFCEGGRRGRPFGNDNVSKRRLCKEGGERERGRLEGRREEGRAGSMLEMIITGGDFDKVPPSSD